MTETEEKLGTFEQDKIIVTLAKATNINIRSLGSKSPGRLGCLLWKPKLCHEGKNHNIKKNHGLTPLQQQQHPLCLPSIYSGGPKVYALK